MTYPTPSDQLPLSRRIYLLRVAGAHDAADLLVQRHRPMRIARRCADCQREFSAGAQYTGRKGSIVCRGRGDCAARAKKSTSAAGGAA